MPVVKNVVYGYLLAETFNNTLPSNLPTGLVPQELQQANPLLQGTLDGFVHEIRNRLPQRPISKAIVTANPLIVFNALQFILEFLETQQPGPLPPTPKRRLFSLFPNPSFKWRFLKIDGNNNDIFFPNTQSALMENEGRVDNILRRFYAAFNFEKLRICTQVT